MTASRFLPEGTPERTIPSSPISPEFSFEGAPSEPAEAGTDSTPTPRPAENVQVQSQQLSRARSNADRIDDNPEAVQEAVLSGTISPPGSNEDVERVSRKRSLSLAFLDELLDGLDANDAVSNPTPNARSVYPRAENFEAEDLIVPEAYAPEDILSVEPGSDHSEEDLHFRTVTTSDLLSVQNRAAAARAKHDEAVAVFEAEVSVAQNAVDLAKSALAAHQASRSSPAPFQIPGFCDHAAPAEQLQVGIFEGSSWGPGWTYFGTRGRGTSPGARPMMNDETNARIEAGGVSRADLSRAVIGVEPWTSRERDRLEKAVRRLDADAESGQPETWSLSQWETVRVSAGLTRSAADIMCRYNNVESPSAVRARHSWSQGEDARLHAAVRTMNHSGWAGVASRVGGQRGALSCLQRFVHHCSQLATSAGKPWTAAENGRLLEAIAVHGESWVTVSLVVGTRDRQACMHHYRKQLMPGRVVGKWSAAEIEQLRAAVAREGEVWFRVAQHVVGRSDVQCREKWKNSLAPTIARGKFSRKESALLLALAHDKGDRWADVAAVMPWRTPKQCRRRVMRLRNLSGRGFFAGKSARK